MTISPLQIPQTAGPAEKGSRPGTGEPARATTPQADRFSAIWSEVQGEPGKVSVQRGDTLVGIVKKQHQQLGVPVDDRQAYREALRLAQVNQIANPNLIRPGDQLQLATPAQAWLNMNGATIANRSTATTGAPVAPSDSPAPGASVERSLLDHTLQRAADKGYVLAQDIGAAKAKIMAMADQFGFEPEHFAMLTLMESSGMNPKASNGQCHGIIQFCEGQQRGAASVGMAGRSRNILGMNVLQQLDLVERYFKDVARPSRDTKMTLDELYLSVLTPSARQEQRRHVALPIGGRQAQILYESTASGPVITRHSIVQGLTTLAQQYFPNWRPKAEPTHWAGRAEPSAKP